MTKRLLVASGLLLVGLAGTVPPSVAGGHPGRDVFYGASPSCLACHNERRGDLAYSQVSPDAMRAVIANGKPEQMPAYRFSPQELEALVDFLLSIRAKVAK
jgi:mono/diheme cytochrome c family protein